MVEVIKGKSAIHLARVYGEKRRNFVGLHFWARGYFVSIVGRDEEMIREYIRNQEHEDQRLEQMNLWRREPPDVGSGKCGAALATPNQPLRTAHKIIAPDFVVGYLLVLRNSLNLLGEFARSSNEGTFRAIEQHALHRYTVNLAAA